MLFHRQSSAAVVGLLLGVSPWLASCAKKSSAAVASASSGFSQVMALTGCTLADYSLSATIGGEASYSLIADSGSTTLAVAGSTCSNCTGVAPTYSDSHGTSVVGVETASYGSGSWTGPIFSDTVQVGNLSTVTDDFGVITSQTTFFGDQNCALGGATDPNQNQGIMGLAFSTLAVPHTVGYLDALTSASSSVPNIFSTQLCEVGGQIWFGGFDTSSMSTTPQYTPLVSEEFYTINVSDMKVGGTSIGESESAYATPIVDTGTSITQMPTLVFNALTASIESNATFAANFGSSFFTDGDCLTSGTGATTAQLSSELPELTISFPTGSGSTFSVTEPATVSYLDVHAAASGGGVFYCPGVAPESGGTPIIGGSFLRGLITIFDRTNDQVGFALNASGC